MDKLIANRYLLVTNIGQGGMADVYKAIDTILNREVAIKILRGELSHDPMTLLRFQREASAASKLSHPNVVDVYDVGESEGRHYIVMEYVRGRTLKQLITQRGALNLDEAIDIMMQLASAISLAHEKHIIHRDIKPQNVLVKDDGTVKITDFGIAVAHDSVQLTQNHTVMGSAHYLAPETTKGEAPTTAVDIYALGIVFYELLSGKVPFNGNTPTEIAIKHLREPMPYIRDFNPLIPQSVENIILKATAKRVEQRYASVDDMIDDLAHCQMPQYANVSRIQLENDPILSVKVEDGHLQVEQQKSRKKKRKWILAIGTAIFSLVVVSIVALFATGVLSFNGWLGTPIPKVVGLSSENAIALLEEAGFDRNQITIEEVLDETVEKGNVSSVDPEENKRAGKNDTIILKVSRGGYFTVENYVGMTLPELREIFSSNHVNIRIQQSEVPRSDVTKGTILSQSIPVGEKIDPLADNEISLTIASSPSFTIPSNIIGMDLQEAKNLLSGYGAAVVTSRISEDTLNEEEKLGSGVVVRCDPSPNKTYTQEGTDSYIVLYYY
ncbi:Stk1 family PASTA domain-containing Ser/Thr kinase [Merdibacter massiliensis]|uniref:Stk1 family PASTA domain-containing Ser/Thr kinase n=1 Tax=Merdibacter massiliensis TaxID=1871030 RepID=UPI00096A9836|nr:Stk1 family PASTA domain-containing Ser/Thr kinase [Merdibacter massiliensis]